MNTATIPIIPITASLDGKRNAFTHACKHTQQSRHYASCLHIASPDSKKSEHFKTLYSDCITAVDKGLCPAVDMRNKEIEAGKALYFKERVRHIGQKLIDAAFTAMGGRSPTTEQSEKVVEEVKKRVPSKSSKNKSVVTQELVASGDMSDALNYALASGKAVEKNPEPAKKVETAPSSKPSLMDLAKQMLAEKGKK